MISGDEITDTSADLSIAEVLLDSFSQMLVPMAIVVRNAMGTTVLTMNNAPDLGVPPEPLMCSSMVNQLLTHKISQILS